MPNEPCRPPDSEPPGKCGSRSKVCAPSLVDHHTPDPQHPLFRVLCRQGVIFPHLLATCFRDDFGFFQLEVTRSSQGAVRVSRVFFLWTRLRAAMRKRKHFASGQGTDPRADPNSRVRPSPGPQVATRVRLRVMPHVSGHNHVCVARGTAHEPCISQCFSMVLPFVRRGVLSPQCQKILKGSVQSTKSSPMFGG